MKSASVLFALGLSGLAIWQSVGICQQSNNAFAPPQTEEGAKVGGVQAPIISLGGELEGVDSVSDLEPAIDHAIGFTKPIFSQKEMERMAEPVNGTWEEGSIEMGIARLKDKSLPYPSCEGGTLVTDRSSKFFQIPDDSLVPFVIGCKRENKLEGTVYKYAISSDPKASWEPFLMAKMEFKSGVLQESEIFPRTGSEPSAILKLKEKVEVDGAPYYLYDSFSAQCSKEDPNQSTAELVKGGADAVIHLKVEFGESRDISMAHRERELLKQGQTRFEQRGYYAFGIYTAEEFRRKFTSVAASWVIPTQEDLESNAIRPLNCPADHEVRRRGPYPSFPGSKHLTSVYACVKISGQVADVTGDYELIERPDEIGYEFGVVKAGIPQSFNYYVTTHSESPQQIVDHPIRFRDYYLYNEQTLGVACLVPHSYAYTIDDQDGTPSARLDFKIKRTGATESRNYSIKDLIGLYERAPDSTN